MAVCEEKTIKKKIKIIRYQLMIKISGKERGH